MFIFYLCILTPDDLLNMMEIQKKENMLNDKAYSFEEFSQIVIADYILAYKSRQVSLVGRKEVLTGKAKFGIFGDGKEIAQIAMAKTFQNGDFRSGYYRDQTFMFAIGQLTIEQFFAQLYANSDTELEPCSSGRSMTAHFATRSLNADGSWKNLLEMKNSSADISPTAGQMPRLVGLAWASKLYRQNPELKQFSQFSNGGNEVAFGTIGDASTSEGLFFETLNAAAVLQIPLAISVWDDGYGISVPIHMQTVQQSISKALQGFKKSDTDSGIQILSCKGWDYIALCEMYEKGIQVCRDEHVPVLFHVCELTQPQGHSTSGSHERYKSKERLAWEESHDCLLKMREWLLENAFIDSANLETLENEAKNDVLACRKRAWDAFTSPLKSELQQVCIYFDALIQESTNRNFIEKIKNDLIATIDATRRDIISAVKKVLRITVREKHIPARMELLRWNIESEENNKDRYNSFLYSESAHSALLVEEVPVKYADDAALVDGREVLNANFNYILENDPRVIAFGEDVGHVGDVNQGFAGLQNKFGKLRVTDSGIREATIAGQGIGLAMRGLRPIAEIQYLDYLLYALQVLSDDLATLHYRTKGGQKAPVIIRTRGHRLEGIWHSGSPMGVVINALKGIYVLVPRNMTQAAGFYNTLLASDDSGIIIESLNSYRLKEKLPENIGQFRLPIGVPEVLLDGHDVTIVSYGSCLKQVLEAALQLREIGISCEVMDVQTLIPFDIHNKIGESLSKTNKVLFVDEDVPGGATAYMMQQALEVNRSFQYLDTAPVTLSAKAHRPAYGSDGDYFSKPNTEQIFDAVYQIMQEYDPGKFLPIY